MIKATNLLIFLLASTIFIPNVYKPEPPQFNEQMIDLYFDDALPLGEFEVWQHLDPSPHIADLDNITYAAPESYLVKEAWFYFYEDSTYHSLRVSRKNVEGCMPAFTFEEGGPNIPIGGEWCLIMVNPNLNVFGDDAYIFRNTSPYTVDVFMFKVVVNPLYCPTCIPNKPPFEEG